MQPIRIIGGVARPAARAAGGVAKAAGKALEGVASAFESLFGGAPAKPRDDAKRPLDAGAPPSKVEIDEALQREQDQQSARRAKYVQKFSREVPDERQRDADIEHDKKGRERTRGE